MNSSLSSSGAGRWTLSEPADRRRFLGNRGEAIAERFLRKRGFRIRERGYRNRCGEIDLIADDGEELVFVEVKTRTSGSCGDPLEAVTFEKRRRIIRAASLYLLAASAWDHPCRFDLVAVRLRPDGTEEIEHIRAAFQAG